MTPIIAVEMCIGPAPNKMNTYTPLYNLPNSIEEISTPVQVAVPSPL